MKNFIFLFLQTSLKFSTTGLKLSEIESYHFLARFET